MSDFVPRDSDMATLPMPDSSIVYNIQKIRDLIERAHNNLQGIEQRLASVMKNPKNTEPTNAGTAPDINSASPLGDELASSVNRLDDLNRYMNRLVSLLDL